MNVNIIKTIIFFIVVIYIIIYINKYYIETYNTIQKSTKKNLTAHPEYIYIYVPLLFFIASKAILFGHADGFFELYIKKMKNSVNDHEHAYYKTDYFTGFISVIAIYIFSLLSTSSATALGDEGVVIYFSICLIMYFYFKFKDIMGLKNVYTGTLINLGYAIGLILVFGSMISTLFFTLETMVINKNINLLSIFGVIVCAIPFIYYLVGEKEVLIKIDKLSFDIKNIGYVALFSLLIGIISFIILKTMVVIFNYVIRSKFNNLYVIIFGFILAFIIKTIGFLTLSEGHNGLNESFQAVFNQQKIKKLESEKNYDELEKLKKLEKEGKFTTINKLDFNMTIGRIINCIISIGSGLTGDLLIPFLTFGCGFGSILHKYTPIIEQNLMYLGMTAFLSPFLGAPISSALLVQTISNQTYESLPYSLCASFISYFTYTFLENKFFLI
jgi:H+/Cl- antiporter ClcA